MKWNQRLKAARESKDLGKSEFARRIKVSAATLTNWENGKVESIKGENLIKVCRELGITEAWLMSGQPQAQAAPEKDSGVFLAYLTAREMELLTKYRERSERGKLEIEQEAEDAERASASSVVGDQSKFRNRARRGPSSS